MDMIEHRVMINGIEVAARYSERAVNGIFIPFLKKLTEMQQAAGRRILVMMAAANMRQPQRMTGFSCPRGTT